MGTAPERVIEKIKTRIEVAENGCWMWQGALSTGYGRIAWAEGHGRMRYGSVHRLMYEDANGPIAEGMDIDHLCHDPATCAPAVANDCPHRACCNPAHLGAATRRENLLRGGGLAAERRAVTHCPRGHEYSDDNTITSKLGQRYCKTCVYEKNRAYYWKNVEKRREYNRAWRLANKKEK